MSTDDYCLHCYHAFFLPARRRILKGGCDPLFDELLAAAKRKGFRLSQRRDELVIATWKKTPVVLYVELVKVSRRYSPLRLERNKFREFIGAGRAHWNKKSGVGFAEALGWGP